MTNARHASNVSDIRRCTDADCDHFVVDIKYGPEMKESTDGRNIMPDANTVKCGSVYRTTKDISNHTLANRSLMIK